jgi:hypothetical protein
MLTSLSFITDGEPPVLELEILDEDAREYNPAPPRAISLPKIEYEPREGSLKPLPSGIYIIKNIRYRNWVTLSNENDACDLVAGSNIDTNAQLFISEMVWSSPC